MKKTYYEQVPLKVVKKIATITQLPGPEKEPKLPSVKSGKKR
ncbi:MAG TPA: hypothetical protein VK525_15165 [Candidatus Saccharimonadales bacterium]|nr:hypothetical protein [Candidatus Saccharimonadales bacterium]